LYVKILSTLGTLISMVEDRKVVAKRP